MGDLDIVIKELQDKLGRLNGRINDLDSMLCEVRGMRDPRNTMGRLDTFAGEMEHLMLRIGKVEQKLVESVKVVGEVNEPKKKIGRPAKKVVA